MSISSLYATLAAAMLLPLASAAQISATSTTRTPVLVELFTSEGCSSCPPADALLARLEHDQPVAGADVIVLEEHVDYWDSLGWHDRFSSPLMTERQRQYSAHFHLDDIYTPQMVVAGSTQFVGSDSRAAAKAIVSAAQAKNYQFYITGVVLEKDKVLGHLSLKAGVAGMDDPKVSYDIPPQAELYAALVSPHQTTAVRAGENGGRTLMHVGVVRSLVRIGDTESWKRALANGTGLPVSADTRGLTGPLRLVVFAQAKGNGRILGAVVQDLPASPDQSKSTAMARP